MEIITKLNDFIDLAERNRKYAGNTAVGYKAALRKLAEVLNEDEGRSIDLIEQRFPQIMTAFYLKHKSVASVSSMDVYQKRIKKVIREYKKWGTELGKWNAWVALPLVKRSRAEKKEEGSGTTTSSENENLKAEIITTSNDDKTVFAHGTTNLSNKTEISLRPGVAVFISTPSDLTKSEARKIVKYAQYLEDSSKDD
jgi:hypothetical protein